MELTKNLRIFRRTHALETQIDDFLNNLSISALVFKSAIPVYLEHGCNAEFNSKHQEVNELEAQADNARRDISNQLYSNTLIPESRGDVLGLLENLDKIINLMEGLFWGLSNENPDIPEAFHDDFIKLTNTCNDAVEAIVMASRAFFRNIEAVEDHNHKVIYFETQADKISTELKRNIFRSDMELAKKLHLKDFVEQIDNIADWSEDVADRLAIYVIKRGM